MADKKISDLTGLSAADVAVADIIPIVDVTAGLTKGITYEALFGAVRTAQISTLLGESVRIGGSALTESSVQSNTGHVLLNPGTTNMDPGGSDDTYNHSLILRRPISTDTSGFEIGINSHIAGHGGESIAKFDNTGVTIGPVDNYQLSVKSVSGTSTGSMGYYSFNAEGDISVRNIKDNNIASASFTTAVPKITFPTDGTVTHLQQIGFETQGERRVTISNSGLTLTNGNLILDHVLDSPPNSPFEERRVGLGTSSPTEVLDVVGNIKASGSITASNSAGMAQLKASGLVAQLILEDSDQSSEGTITNTGGDLYYTSEGTGTDYGNHYFMTQRASDSNAKAAIMTIYGVDETVGIRGYISVTRAGSTYDNAPKIQLRDSDGTNQIGEVICSGGNLQLVSRNNTGKGIISFIQDDGTDRITAMKISSGGKVGIGLHPDNNVLEDFHVGGSARIDGDFFGNIGSNTFAVKSSTNNVGIGTSAPPANYKLVVAGDSRFTGSGVFGATATTGNKGLQKHYSYSDAGAFRLFRTNSAANSITMKYQSSTSNEFVITQVGSSSDVIRFNTDTTKLVSNVEIGINGNAKSLLIRDGRDSSDGLRFNHSGVNDEVQMGMYGSYGHVDQGRFKITHKNSNDANTTVLQIEKNGTQLQILKPTKISGQLNLGSVPEYGSNALAKAGGLVDGDVYRTNEFLKVVYS